MATYNVYLEAYTLIEVEASNETEAKMLAEYEAKGERANWAALEVGVIL